MVDGEGGGRGRAVVPVLAAGGAHHEEHRRKHRNRHCHEGLPDTIPGTDSCFPAHVNSSLCTGSFGNGHLVMHLPGYKSARGKGQSSSSNTFLICSFCVCSVDWR